MKYFIDFEFIEGFKKPLFSKRRHFIDMISVGITCDDGRNYYAISSEYNYKDASDWVKENVIIPMYKNTVSGDSRNHWSASDFHYHFGLTNKMIAEDIVYFCYPEQSKSFTHYKEEFLVRSKKYGWEGKQPEFYGYYCDYDWVLFCSLFGTMMQLPKGFPMYCKDLKQMLDERAVAISQLEISTMVYQSDMKLLKEVPEKEVKDISDWTFDMKLTMIKSHKDFPKQQDEHHALSDAKWNKSLYNFLQTI